MNKQKLAYLLFVVFFLAAVAFFSRPKAGPGSSASSEEILAGINGEQVAKLVLEKGEDSIELAANDKGWGIPSRANYPADVGKIRALLLKLLGASSVQQLPSSDAGIKKLGLTEEGIKEGFGRVLLYDGQGKELGGLYIGKMRIKPSGQGGPPIGGGGQYVRRTDDSAVYMLAAPINLNATMMNWLQTDLINVLKS